MTKRILFFGMEGIFSRAPLHELINAHHHICAIITPRPKQSNPASKSIRRLALPRATRTDVPLANEPRDPNIIRIAWNAGIDVYEVSSLRNDATLETIQRLQPTLIVVACFNLLLPQSLITNYKALNLHPSLLPEYRGPAPLFWIFHDGLEHAGVTIHLIDAHADTGDIVAQERVTLPDGISYDNADDVLSQHAARLLTQVLDESSNGQFARTPQPQITAPLAPIPSERDYFIATDWSVRRAFNFIRGIGRARLEIGERRLVIENAISFQEGEKLGAEFLHQENFSKIQFADGTLTIRSLNL